LSPAAVATAAVAVGEGPAPHSQTGRALPPSLFEGLEDVARPWLVEGSPFVLR
jgi:hypothetical protein